MATGKDYAEAVARRGASERSDRQIASFVELRMARQAVLRREPDPFQLWVVLDEAALRRVVGSPTVMRDQLLRLADMARDPKITVQVVPYGNGAHPGLMGRFQILDFRWPTDPGVAYIEHRAGALYLEEPHEVEYHTVAFERICAFALPPDHSATMIQDVVEEIS